MRRDPAVDSSNHVFTLIEVLAMKESNSLEPIAVTGTRAATWLGQGKTDNGPGPRA